MELYGAQRLQPVAISGKSPSHENCGNKRNPLPPTWSDVVIEEGTAAPSDFAPRPASPRTAAQTRPPSDLANANSVVGWPAFVVHARGCSRARADTRSGGCRGADHGRICVFLSDSLLAAAVPPPDRATALTLRHVKLHIWVRMACSTDDAAEQCRAPKCRRKLKTTLGVIETIAISSYCVEHFGERSAPSDPAVGYVV